MNGFTENECLPNLELKFKISENLRKPLTLKSTRKHIDLFAHWCSSQKKKKRLVLLRWLQLCDRYRTHRFATHAISVFHVKFNVGFTRQAVNFSIQQHVYWHPFKEPHIMNSSPCQHFVLLLLCVPKKCGHVIIVTNTFCSVVVVFFNPMPQLVC